MTSATTIDRSLKELNAERDERARGVFTSAQIHNWEAQARLDAEADKYNPPKPEDLALGEHVYCMAWCRKRDKIGRAERDAAEAKYRDENSLPSTPR